MNHPSYPDISRFHAKLMADLADSDKQWSRVALLSCLRRVEAAEMVQWGTVQICAAATLTPESFYVVFFPVWAPGSEPIGLLRGRGEIGDRRYQESEVLRIMALSEVSLLVSESCDDPVAFGQDVADFDICEPMGRRRRHLNYDELGIGWLGGVLDGVPTLSAAAASQIESAKRSLRN